MDKEHEDPYKAWLHQTTSCMEQAEESGKDTRTRCIGSIYSLLNVKDWSSVKQDVMQSSFTNTLPVYCISKVVVMESGEIIYEKVYVAPRPPPTISFNDNGMKDLDSEPNESNQNQKPYYQERWDPMGEQQFTQEIVKDVLFGSLKAPNTQQERWDPWMDQNPSRVVCQSLYKL